MPIGEGSKDSVKAEILAELRAESSAKVCKSAPATPRTRSGGKCAYNQSEVDSAMLRFKVGIPGHDSVD